MGIDGKRFPFLGNRVRFDGAAPAHTKRRAKRGLRSGTLSPVPLPDGPMLFWAAAAVGLGLAWWASDETSG